MSDERLPSQFILIRITSRSDRKEVVRQVLSLVLADRAKSLVKKGGRGGQHQT